MGRGDRTACLLLGAKLLLPDFMNVKESVWADSVRDHWQGVSASIPAVIETEFRLWQLRVDRNAETPHVPHAYLYPITVLRYAQKGTGPERIYAPAEPKDEMTFLVCAQTHREAIDKVKAQLAAHGFDPNCWMMSTGQSAFYLC